MGEFQSQMGRRLILGVIFVGTILRLWVAWQPVETLLSKNLPDDAYYYFVIARNIVQSGSASMDGVHVTNGFHPLWMIVLLPIFGLSSTGSDLPIHLALTLAAVLDVVTILMVGRLAAYFTGREISGILAAWIYAANPIVILQVTNGLETALGMLTLSIFVWQVKGWLIRFPNARSAMKVGVAAAFMFLARSDSIFLLGLAFLVALWYWRKRPGGWRNILLWGGGTFAVIILPWFLWSKLVVGSWFQESGVAVPYAVHERVAMTNGSGWFVVLSESLRRITFPAIWLRGDFSGLPLVFGPLLWLVVASWLIRGWRKSLSRVVQAFLIPLLGSGLALIIAHAGIRWYPRPWYFIPSSLTFALVFVMAGRNFLGSQQRLFLTALAFTVYFVVTGYIFWQAGYFPWQRWAFAASSWLEENIPPGTKIAGFNSGIYTYYNEFPVLNLDGVVSHDAFLAVRDKTVLKYLQCNGVDYLIDYDLEVWKEYAPFMGEGFPENLEEVRILSSKPDNRLGHLRIYRVRR